MQIVWQNANTWTVFVVAEQNGITVHVRFTFSKWEQVDAFVKSMKDADAVHVV